MKFCNLPACCHGLASLVVWSLKNLRNHWIRAATYLDHTVGLFPICYVIACLLFCDLEVLVAGESDPHQALSM